MCRSGGRWRSAAALLLVLLFVEVPRIHGTCPPAAVATAAAAAGGAAELPGRHLQAAGSRRHGSGGAIPQSIIDQYNPARQGRGVSGAVGGRPTRPAPPPRRRRPARGAPPPSPPPGFGVAQYKQVLGLSYKFYEAQRSGKLPPGNRVPWRGDSHLTDLVVGGWHDAGDMIKHSLTIAQSSLFLAWAALDFPAGVAAAGQTGYSRAAVGWAADYLLRCSIGPNRFVGLIGDPDVDHDYWGRPEDQRGPRKPYIWTRSMPASDLLGMTSAALASASLLLRPANATFANRLLAKAQELYRWGADVPGRYSSSYPSYLNDIYGSSRYPDKLMLAAGWLGRATGNASYFAEAQCWYKQAGGADNLSPYVSWDDVSPPAAAVLVSAGLRQGTAKVPAFSDYASFLDTTFLQTYIAADGTWGIVRTPKGLRYPDWSDWGNNRYSANAAFIALLRAQQLPAKSPLRASAIDFAKSQIDYMLGAGGRSFVVGWGTNPPLQCHHAPASCPDRPAPCNWGNFDAPGPNPQVLYGALVAGPAGPGDDTYNDKRTDYVTNEVTIDYNAGFTAALAGLIQLLGAQPG
ncbi:hypothetical protein ABPG75_012087 [Micractinium tetrahymenae]